MKKRPDRFSAVGPSFTETPRGGRGVSTAVKEIAGGSHERRKEDQQNQRDETTKCPSNVRRAQRDMAPDAEDEIGREPELPC